MAEYIDRENAKNLIEVAIEDSWDVDYTLEMLEQINPSNVIERSKIDKAMKQIEELSGQSCMVSDGIIDEVLDILEEI